MSKWNAVHNFVGKYAVSDEGEVMSMNYAKSGLPGIMKPSIGRGYLGVELCDQRRYTIHRLVCEAFLGPRPAGMQINHKNGNKLDNRLENLEYCTASENRRHAFATGLQSNQGSKHSQAKLTEKDVARILFKLRNGDKVGDIAKEYGVHQGQISNIKHGKAWSHVSRELN